MARLIDADALKQKKTVLWDPALGFCECVLVDDIDNAPTAEVVHGQWIGDAGDFKCSTCGEYSACGGYEQTKFCPNCGADMREEPECGK